MGRLSYYSKLSGQALQESVPPQNFADRLSCETVVLKNKRKIHLYTLPVSCKNKV